MNKHLLSNGYARVTARGIIFKSARFTCSKAIRDQWFEKAAFEKEWRVKIIYTLNKELSAIYIVASNGDLEKCNRIDDSKRPSDIKLQLYFQNIQKLKAFRNMQNNDAYIINRDKKKAGRWKN
ncbi:hypothetical protein [Paenibacillus woosongensis]|uniref:Uncharacterized protein n=1 Tax=Paenibacillus woosongensis TaxID=307580 RepID=A0A7X2Z385_9BACL|nr:hypothetical protein [Paenibacillus woosongensis]MUG46749.1 hypothetical protein [Paenibacillus woosongensis]